jgi:threonine dehydratase
VRPDVHVVGVQAAEAAAFPKSLQSGHPVALAAMATMADGIAVGSPGALTLRMVQHYVDSIRTVSEEALSQALLLMLERAKLVVEPAGAAAVAALMDAPADFEPPVVAVLSGGNIDPLLLLRVLRHGMATAGRFLSFRVRIPDRPGHLARLLTEIGTGGASVIDVEHVRTSPTLPVDEVEVAVQAETRGQEHCEELLARLRDAGYNVSVN